VWVRDGKELAYRRMTDAERATPPGAARA
jgi:hypothetical protein